MAELVPDRRRSVSNVTTLAEKRAKSVGSEATSQRITRVYLFGNMRVVGPTGENILPRAKKTQAVLAYLCMAQGERPLRSRLAGIIWDRSGETQARDSLRHALRDLEKVGTWHLDTDYRSVRLDTAGCWIDAFESPDRPDLLLDSLYGVSSSFDHWLISERIRFENRWQSILEDELNELIATEATPELRAAAARKLLNFLPTHEPAVRSLMAAFIDLGDRAQAIREYERFRLVANSSIGLLPSEKTAALYEAIRLESRLGRQRSQRPIQQVATDAVHPTLREEPALPERSGTALGPPYQPSIAVLPFRDLSGEPLHDNIAEGLTEDLVEALSRTSGLFVVSRLSAAAFKNPERTPQEIGDALGVRYILSGSMRLSGDRLRIVVELTDTGSGLALWVSRLDERFTDLFEAQNRLAETVVRRIAPHVRSAEVKRMRVKRPEHQDAYDLLLRAQESMNNPSRAVFDSAEKLFETAVIREPQYAAALAWRAYWHVMRVGQGWSGDPAADTKQADYFAQRAIECDALEPLAFAVQGHVAAYLHKNFDLAFSSFETALRINPNSARAWLWSASAHAWTGDGARAVEKITRAMALSPYDPLRCAYSVSASMAYFADGQYGRGIEFALRCIGENRGYTSPYKLLTAGLVLAGRENEARTPLNQLLMLEPNFTVQRFRQRFPGSAYPIGEVFSDALARAGAPISH